MKVNPIIALFFCTVLASCHRMSFHDPSPAFASFDFTDLITEAGFHSEGFSDSGTANSATGMAKHIRWGTFTAPASSFTCFKVFQRVKKHFDAASQGACAQEGWDPRTEEHPASGPVHIAMLYNQNGRHGDLHLWLYPSEDETKIGFALHLMEQPLH